MARIDWAQLPSEIQHRIERVAGAEVRQAIPRELPAAHLIDAFTLGDG